MGKSPKEKLWLAGAGITALLLAVVGWFFLISPQRQSTNDVRDQVQNAQMANVTLQSRIATLTAQNAKKATYERAFAAAQGALPSVNDPASFLRIMHATAAKTSTSLTALTIGSPQAVAAPVAAAPTSPTPSASSSAPAPTTPAATSSGVYSIQITTGVTGSNPDLYAFLTQLQDVQPRAVLITSVSAGASGAPSTTQAKSGGAMLQLTMQMFVLPDASTAATPTAAPTSP